MNYLPRLRTPAKSGHKTTRLARRLALFADQLTTAVMPQGCEICDGFSGRWPLCHRCEAAIPGLPKNACPACADLCEPGKVCARCLAHPPAFETTVAAFAYTHPVDRLIQCLKYGHQLHLAAWFGHRLAERFEHLPERSALTKGIVVALPLHPERLSERGFNQATEIARPLSRALGFPLHHDLCHRVRPTRPQAQLTLIDRHHNVDQAFECRGSLSGETVIVVDDVMTSGASIGELARVLKLHGAGRIIAAAAARTLHP